MSKEHSVALKAAILTMSLVQLGTNGIGPILAQIAAAFPGTSDTTVQFLMTFPILFTMIFEILSALAADRLPKKLLTIAGLVVVGAGGIMAVLFHTSITIMFVWAGVIGIGLGMVAPIAPALINENYVGQEKQTMLGWQNSASTIGSMLMTFACGFLATMGWNYGYLVYLIGIPGIICAFIGLPSGTASAAGNANINVNEDGFANVGSGTEPVQTNKKEGRKNANARSSRSRSGAVLASERGRFRLVIWREMIIAALFLMLYSAIPANISMLMVENGAGDASVSGVVTTLFSLAGMLVGLIFGLIMKLFRKFTNTLGVIMLAAGSFIMGTASSLPVMIIGCMVAGTSMSMVMPVCMGAASRLPGYEVINSALIMASTSVGIFITPLLTSLTAAVTGSEAVSTRFLAFGVIGIVLAAITVLLKIEKHSDGK